MIELGNIGGIAQADKAHLAAPGATGKACALALALSDFITMHRLLEQIFQNFLDHHL